MEICFVIQIGLSNEDISSYNSTFLCIQNVFHANVYKALKKKKLRWAKWDPFSVVHFMKNKLSHL